MLAAQLLHDILRVRETASGFSKKRTRQLPRSWSNRAGPFPLASLARESSFSKNMEARHRPPGFSTRAISET
jgi:hypothetical protein